MTLEGAVVLLQYGSRNSSYHNVIREERRVYFTLCCLHTIFILCVHKTSAAEGYPSPLVAGTATLRRWVRSSILVFHIDHLSSQLHRGLKARIHQATRILARHVSIFFSLDLFLCIYSFDTSAPFRTEDILPWTFLNRQATLICVPHTSLEQIPRAADSAFSDKLFQYPLSLLQFEPL